MKRNLNSTRPLTIPDSLNVLRIGPVYDQTRCSPASTYPVLACADVYDRRGHARPVMAIAQTTGSSPHSTQQFRGNLQALWKAPSATSSTISGT